MLIRSNQNRNEPRKPRIFLVQNFLITIVLRSLCSFSIRETKLKEGHCVDGLDWFNPLSPNVAILTMNPIIICLLTFLHTFSIRPQNKMHRRRAAAPPAVHSMLQTNRKMCRKSQQSYSNLEHRFISDGRKLKG